MHPGQNRILPLLLFGLFSLTFALKLQEVQSTYDRSHKVINEDAFGYYLILPAFFKYHDHQFAFLDSSLSKTESYSSYIPPVVNRLENGQKVCKYYSGVALLQAPFYLMAQMTDSENGHGFGDHYQFWILMSVVFYVLAGSWLYYRQMLDFKLSPFLAFGLILFIVLGTNLYTYTTYDPAYSHAYTYFAIACLIRSLFSWKKNSRLSALLCVGLSLGLIAVIRPLNVYLSVSVPIVLGVKSSLAILKKSRQLGILISGLIVFPLLQSLIWHWQTGQYFVYPYGNEHLNLSHPQIIGFLFSYNCGWALYTPSAFLLLTIGILLQFANGKYTLGLVSFAGFFILIYLLSSWYYLHYGCTAGCRPMTDYYGLMGLLMAKGLAEFEHKRMLKWLIIPVLLTSYAHNRVVQYQFFNHIINWCDMDQQRFSMVFMRTHEVYKYSTYPFWDFSRYAAQKEFEVKKIQRTLKSEETLETQFERLQTKDSPVLVTLRARAKSNSRGAYLRILVTDNNGYIDQQLLLLMRKIKTDGQWHEFEFQFPVNKDLDRPKFWIKLEDAGMKGDAEIAIDEVGIRVMETGI